MFENHAQNNKSISSCYFGVGNCPKCAFKKVIKYGFCKRGLQRFQCKGCKATFISTYSRRYISNIRNEEIKVLLKEGCGIRSIGRILKISAVTVIRRIRTIASYIRMPEIKMGQVFEVDELCTYIGNKFNRIWIACIYCKESKSITDFVIGSRSKVTLAPLLDRLLCYTPSKIYTDKHQTYTTIIPAEIHSTKYRGTNHIERKNLTLRTHLKRLGRRTICFSRSITMLHACLMIYFFG